MFRSVILLLSLLAWIGVATATSKVTTTTTSTTTPRSTKPAFPNIILILTDDLDLTLGGMEASSLSMTRSHLANEGTVVRNWFAQTPICCPSRSELLTGKMFHNLRTTIPTDGNVQKQEGSIPDCMHVNVSEDIRHPFYSRDYFANFFAGNDYNYTVGVFGKHLNSQNPRTCPPGVDRWLVNGGGDYLNPTFYWASRGVPPTTVTFDNCTTTLDQGPLPCYSTSIIGNGSLAWIQDHVKAATGKPFFAYISVKAPHLQDGQGFPMAIPAPWYANRSLDNDSAAAAGSGGSSNNKAPRTPNYNQTCPHHHWLVRSQLPMTKYQGKMVDDLYISRLKTLWSVDDLVNDAVSLLEDLQILNNTFIIFTSDNGYRLGQYQMTIGKFHAYDNDIRVPMMIRGPGIPKGFINTHTMGTHVDLIPTVLGLITGITNDSVIPWTMDGTNLAQDLVREIPRDESSMVDSSKSTFASYPPPRGDQAPSSTPGLSMITSTNRTTHGSAPSRPTTGSALATTFLLIEYMSLGTVVRYEHLEDTYNHTFLALRMTTTSGSNMEESGNMDDRRKDYNATQPIMNRRRHHHQKQFKSFPRTLHNLKYVEYRDGRFDWNFTKDALEIELFDLDRDPYELTNLATTCLKRTNENSSNNNYHDYCKFLLPGVATGNLAGSTVATAGKSTSKPGRQPFQQSLTLGQLIGALHDKAIRMFHCVGNSCRNERYSGLLEETLRVQAKVEIAKKIQV